MGAFYKPGGYKGSGSTFECDGGHIRDKTSIRVGKVHAVAYRGA
jgi:hypothetical protein